MDLGRPDAFHGKDTQMIDDFRRVLGPHPVSPFFSYVLLTENHGPHQCDVTDLSQMPVHFADTAEFEPNCLLHEYLRRLKSTQAALASLLHYLPRQRMGPIRLQSLAPLRRTGHHFFPPDLECAGPTEMLLQRDSSDAGTDA